MTIRVGMIGTSWWADAMYLPALKNHPHGQVTAICGRNRDTAQKVADQWSIPKVYTDYNALIDSGDVQAIIISTPNDTHYPIAIRALEAGLHVLCEKPLGLTYAEAHHMAELAEAKGVKHLTPFTYSHMPTNRYIKDLIDGGYIGKPYHLNLRYYAGYGRSGEYFWRFDVGKAGAGAVGDIGSHFLYLASWYYGQIASVSCQLSYNVPRPPVDASGQPYTVGDDAAIVTLQFENGAQGVVHVTTVAHEPTTFGQTHHMEFHGSEGTLYNFCDWDTVQRVSGARQGEKMQEHIIPEIYWGSARRDTVPNTYQDVFRTQDFMAREFVTAIAENLPLNPDFHDGAYIQRVIEAAVQSHHQRCWVDVESVGA